MKLYLRILPKRKKYKRGRITKKGRKDDDNEYNRSKV